VDETRQDATPADAGWPWRSDPPGGTGEPRRTGRPRATRRDTRPDLRVSDAERDAVVTELGEHFQQGRLDQAEFDERVTKALAAKTESDLDGLLADLPAVREAAVAPQPVTWARRLPVLVPLLFAAVLIAGSLAGGPHHPWAGGWFLWPLWWLVPIMVLRFAWWRRGWQRRQWR